MTTDLNKIYQVPLFMHILMAPINACIILYMLLVSFEVSAVCKYMFSLFATVIQLFLFCYLGNDLHQHVVIYYIKTNRGCHISFQSLAVADGVYSSDWMSFSIKEKKQFVLLIQRCQKPQVYNAFDFFHFDLPTYANVILN